MKKTILSLLVIFTVASTAFAQSFTYSTFNSVSSVGPDSADIVMLNNGSIDPGADSLIFNFSVIATDGVNVVVSDSLNSTGLHIFTLHGLEEGTEYEFYGLSEILDTVNMVVIDPHQTPLYGFTTTYAFGIPGIASSSFLDSTSGSGTIAVTGPNGEAGSWFYLNHVAGPVGGLSDSTYGVGEFSDFSLMVTNLQPQTEYTYEVVASDPVNGITLPVGAPITFTTGVISGPLATLDSVYVSADSAIVEFVVIPNGGPTNVSLLLDGTPLFQMTITDTLEDSYTAAGLAFGTQYVFELIAEGVDTVSVAQTMTTLPLSALSVGLITYDSTGIFEGILNIPISSPGGVSDVIVEYPDGGTVFAVTTAQVGLDTLHVPTYGLQPNTLHGIEIDLERVVDGESLLITHPLVTYQVLPIDIQSFEVSLNSNSYSFELTGERTVPVGAISADIQLDKFLGGNWVPMNLIEDTFATGMIDQVYSYTNLDTSTQYRVTVDMSDTLAGITQSTLAWFFTTSQVAPVPTAILMPMELIFPDSIGTVSFMANPLSLSGGTAYFRAASVPSLLSSETSNADSVDIPNIGTYQAEVFVGDYIFQGVDTLYYKLVLENEEGGIYESAMNQIALPEYIVPPPPPVEGPVEFLGTQPFAVDSTAAIITAGFNSNGLDSVEVSLHAYSLSGGYSTDIGPLPFLGADLNFHLTGLPDSTEIFYEFDVFVAGDYDNTFGLYSFITLASPVPPPPPPSGIEEIVQAYPGITGEVYNILGGKLAEGVRLEDLKNHSVGFGSQIIIWENKKAGIATKVVSH
jgi:hypothetical protein